MRLAGSILQRSKATWIRRRDECTKYFFSIIKQRKLIQSVVQIQDIQGNLHHEPEAIAKVFVQYFQSILGEAGDHRVKASDSIFAQGETLTIDQQCELFKPCSDKKLRLLCVASKILRSQVQMVTVAAFIKLLGA